MPKNQPPAPKDPTSGDRGEQMRQGTGTRTGIPNQTGKAGKGMHKHRLAALWALIIGVTVQYVGMGRYRPSIISSESHRT